MSTARRWRRRLWPRIPCALNLSKVRGYLVWLAAADMDGDPLTERRARDWAVRDYRGYLMTVAKRAPTTVNNTLAATDDFYTRRGLSPAVADRLDLPYPSESMGG